MNKHLGFPACPFAAKWRKDGKLRIEVRSDRSKYERHLTSLLKDDTTYDNPIPYSMMLIQKFKQLYEASCKLHKIGYYKKWPPEYYEEVVATRQKTYEKLFRKGVTS